MADLTRPIIGIENRTAQEVFDIMCDRFRAYERAEAELAAVKAERDEFAAIHNEAFAAKNRAETQLAETNKALEALREAIDAILTEAANMSMTMRRRKIFENARRARKTQGGE